MYLLPFSVFAEKKADDAVIRGEIEVSGNPEASCPSETNGRTPERQTEIFFDNSDDASLTLTNAYQFATKENNETSALISQYTSTIAPTGGNSTSVTYLYEYDENGNITEIRNHANTLLYRYAYDMKGQLIREDNLPLNRTYVYAYDSGGNILSQTWYNCTFTTSTENLSNSVLNRVYTYDGDRMTSFKGQTVTYDSIGNPTNYRGKRMTWQQVRQLASVLTSSGTYAYAYNADGLRIGKDNGTIATEYILNGSQVMRQIIIDGTTTYVADYLYHENGTPMAFAYYPLGGTPVYYFYELTLQGDIVGIYDANGAKVVGFRYNAWGSFNTDISNSTVCTDTFLRASLFRYRSYIYDYETSFYYLQSRYYDPETGRFLNADGQLNGGTLGYNLYAYCENNPVNYIDSTGHMPRWATIALGAVAAAAAITLTVATFGAYAPAAACTLTMVGMSLGASYAVASTAATVAVVATTVVASAYAGDIAYSMVTGESLLLNTVFQGNTEAYETGKLIASMATAGFFEAAAMSPGVCFVAGTSVLTEAGQVPIEQIKTGDKVWAKNHETGEVALKSVVQTFINETDELVHVFANGDEIVTTPEHPFYVVNKGWVSAIQLRAGDILVSLNGNLVVLEKIQHEILEAPVTVYNFEVEDFHTYFVGDDGGILVHNTCYSGTSDAPDTQEPNSSYKKLGANNKIRSIAYYDCAGRQNLRLDFDHSHANVQPHIHIYSYNERGQINYKAVWDFNGNVIDG